MDVQTFDASLPVYAEAIRKAFQEEGDIEKAREKVAELRAAILRLPTQFGIRKELRVTAMENRIFNIPSIIESDIEGGSHD